MNDDMTLPDGADSDPISDLLEQVLAAADDQGPGGASATLERLCAEHPERAQALRRRAALLADLGVFSPPDSDGTPASGSAPLAGAEPPVDGAPLRLGPYRLLATLGVGGMGVVHLAEQEDLGRRVAVKVIRPEHLFFPGARERFRREVETVARLQHPGIVPVFSVGDEGGVPYFAMEYVRGCSLADVLDDLREREADPRRLTGQDLADAVERCASRADARVAEAVAASDGALAGPATDADDAPTSGDGTTGGEPDTTSDTGGRARPASRSGSASGSGSSGTGAWLFSGTWEAACLRLVRLVAEALEHAHRRGVVHRDLKPSNLMLTHGEAGGQVKLLDFGLAAQDPGAEASAATRLTRSGSRLGSLPYMAPEQVAGRTGALDARTDVYALGVTLYELLTLRRPFDQPGEAALLAAIERGDAPRPRSLNPGLTWEAETVCLAAMDGVPARRYASADDLARDLDNATRRRPLEARRVGPLRRGARWVQRNPLAATTAALTAVLLVGVPLLFLMQEKQNSAEVRRQLERADAHFARSLDAIDRMLTRVAAEELADIPQMEPVRLGLLEDAVALTEATLADEGDDPRARARTAVTSRHLGMLQCQLGRLDEGLASLRRCLDLTTGLLDELQDGAPAATDDDPTGPSLQRHELLAQRAHAKGLLAEGLKEAGDLAAAEQAFRDGDADMVAALELVPGQPQLLHRRARNLTQLGDLLNRRLGIEDAPEESPGLAVWMDAAEQYQQAMELLPDEPDVLSDLGELRIAMAQHLMRVRSAPRPRPLERALLDEADRVLDRAAPMDPDEPVLLFRRAVAKQVRGKLHAMEGDFAGAAETVQTALPGLAELVRRYPLSPRYHIEYATVLNELGVLSEYLGRMDQARLWYGRGVDELDVLVERYPDLADLLARCGQGHMNLAVALKSLGEPKEALPHFDRAIVLQEQAIALSPQGGEYPMQLRYHHMARSDCLSMLGRHAEAADAADDLAATLPDDWESHTQAGSQMAIVLDGMARAGALQREAELAAAIRGRGIDYLRRALELGFPYGEQLATEPKLAPLRDDERFDALMDEVAAGRW